MKKFYWAIPILILIAVGYLIFDNKLNIKMKDNGKGINIHQDIFKPYISTKTKGMGLGLHIVLKSIRALDGDIKLVSATPGRTIFKIEIPEGKIK